MEELGFPAFGFDGYHGVGMGASSFMPGPGTPTDMLGTSTGRLSVLGGQFDTRNMRYTNILDTLQNAGAVPPTDVDTDR